ncbi:MAG: GNAT family N-acetyltransferase [Planctomycetes bacterium]|nr:GNAT family N-acetyltransferase [Planctomycetota bacterium]
MSAAAEKSVSFRTASAEDVSALADFIQPFVDEGRLLPRTTRELHELLPHGFIADCDGQIVGFAALEIYSLKLAEIRSLAVAREVQGKGVGRELVARCVKLATEEKILEVMAVTSTDEFFLNCGFNFTLPGERKALFIQTLNDPPCS